jgi:hypothetical protein
VQPAKKRKSAAGSSGGAGGGVLSGAGGAGVAPKSHKAPPKPIQNKPGNPPAKIADGDFTSEDESETELNFDGGEEPDELGGLDEVAATMIDDMKWELGKELPEVSGTFEGLGQPCVRIEPTTSAMYCFELVFPASLRRMIVFETNRYGHKLNMMENRKRMRPLEWKDLDDAEFRVYLGLVVVNQLVFVIFKC